MSPALRTALLDLPHLLQLRRERALSRQISQPRQASIGSCSPRGSPAEPSRHCVAGRHSGAVQAPRGNFVVLVAIDASEEDLVLPCRRRSGLLQRNPFATPEARAATGWTQPPSAWRTTRSSWIKRMRQLSTQPLAPQPPSTAAVQPRCCNPRRVRRAPTCSYPSSSAVASQDRRRRGTRAGLRHGCARTRAGHSRPSPSRLADPPH